MTLQSIIILQGARAFETSRMIYVKYVYIIYVYTLKFNAMVPLNLVSVPIW